jgi:T5SS/PEP-CTERM-associated repeat protein
MRAAAALVGCLGLLLCVSPLRADITWSGDVVPDDPTTWTTSTDAYIGNTGTGTLDITGGGDISIHRSYVGYWGGSFGTVTVDGAGSTLANSYRLEVGYYGTGLLDIINGGSVSNPYGYLGYEPGSSGTANIDGAGSTWSNGMLFVGYKGDAVLNITDGGVLDNDIIAIGEYGSSSSTATIDGAGSTWISRDSLSVGNSGTGVLNIINGAEVTVDNNGTVGTRVSGATGSGTIHFDNGTLTTAGLRCTYSDLTGTGTINTTGLVSDVDLVFDATHGLSQTFLLNSEPGQNITLNLNVDGTGTMGAGYEGSGTMAISDGVAVSSEQGLIGYKAGSTGTVAVDGAGSTWSTVGGFYVGCAGTGALNITNGGRVFNWNAAYVGSSSGSSGVVTVDGAGSTWEIGYVYSSGSTLTVGDYGSGVLNITNGGAVTVAGAFWDTTTRVSSSSGTINFDNGTLTTKTLYSDLCDLTGTGTINTQGLYFNGDLVFDLTTYDELSRSLTVSTNPGQNITMNFVDEPGHLAVGNEGNGTMTISDGVGVSSALGYVARGAASSGTVTVDGAGSSWTNTGYLRVGYGGNGALTITNGGAVSSAEGFLGDRYGGAGMATVDGAGSSWTNTDDLWVSGPGTSALAITGGGAVSNERGFVGEWSGAPGTATVDGAGSSWTNNDGLYVGGRSTGTLTINNGATVSSTTGMIGYASGGSGTVSVNGVGSSWSNSSFLFVGEDATGAVNIINGGVVSNTIGYVGYNSGSSGTVSVDGAGSGWASSGDVYIGYNGAGELTITNGGLARVAGQLVIDAYAGSGLVKMDSDGMLALDGDADGSMQEFLDLVGGTDAIYYWDPVKELWTNIVFATYDIDYTLEYFSAGDLAGYTMLTVDAIPEPATMGLLSLAGLALLRRRRGYAG